MNTQNNLFIVTSTIVTNHGMISSQDRFLQTIETIESIRKNDKNSKIFLIDNSEIPEEIKKILSDKVDMFMGIGQRNATKIFNINQMKGAGELYMLLVAIDFLMSNNLKFKRIFKLSGRYKLSDNFDMRFYDDLGEKFCFKTREKDYNNNFFFHTRMWSVDGNLIEDMKEIIQKSFKMHISNLDKNLTIENCIYKNMNFSKLVEVGTIYCEGYIAPWNKLIQD
jgi:hypothetical protein